MVYAIVWLLLLCQAGTIISSPLLFWEELNERWSTMEKNLMEDGLIHTHTRSKRALQAFAPHITFQHKPGQIIPRAKYGDTCNTTFYENSTKLVYDAAENEDDNEQGTQINATMTVLLTWLRMVTTNSTPPPNNVSQSWLQVQFAQNNMPIMLVQACTKY